MPKRQSVRRTLGADHSRRGAGWLGVVEEDGLLDASVLWGGGSVLPVDCVFVDQGELYVIRLSK